MKSIHSIEDLTKEFIPSLFLYTILLASKLEWDR
jgi:hypothetical protein